LDEGNFPNALKTIQEGGSLSISPRFNISGDRDANGFGAASKVLGNSHSR